MRPGATWPSEPSDRPRTFPVLLPAGAAAEISEPARSALLDAAQVLLTGSGQFLGVARNDLHNPDWFLDPVTGRRAPQDRYAFAVDHRSEEEAGNVKQLWELSRHHHLTTLAAAWLISGHEPFAEAVARHLQTWWRQNPYLSGVHWTSGIELGIRLISWAWLRRLLDGWSGVAELFDHNPVAAQQLCWHQQYLAAFRSAGSSANNHVIAEAAGQLVASCAFPWFKHSDGWRVGAAALLERELERNTFPSGVNRELASDYHVLVAELGLVAAVEAGAAGHPLSRSTWARLCSMVDAAAAIVDEGLRGPRQGDGDDGRVLLLDAHTSNPWPSLLAAGRKLFGALPWWPAPVASDVRSALLGALAGGQPHVGDRPRRRPSHFADAGLTLLRSPGGEIPGVWCRCDGGPHGYLSIAAHAHADALSIEVRHGGVDVLADPGTYCYHGEPAWRSYFRSTLGHNTLELDEMDQSQAGGPFLWVRHASTRLVSVQVDTEDGVETWSAEHDGYSRLDPPAVHRRTVRLDGGAHRLDIVDRVESDAPHRCRLAFHLGPFVRSALEGSAATLSWPGPKGGGSATLSLPPVLQWTAHRGETDPILGWYSPQFGRKEPTTTILGTGYCGSDGGELRTVLQF